MCVRLLQVPVDRVGVYLMRLDPIYRSSLDAYVLCRVTIAVQVYARALLVRVRMCVCSPTMASYGTN
jgi:hypothetical protein